MAKNEVATTEKNFNLVTLTGELKEAVAEELDGLGTLPFERAKIPSGVERMSFWHLSQRSLMQSMKR